MLFEENNTWCLKKLSLKFSFFYLKSIFFFQKTNNHRGQWQTAIFASCKQITMFRPLASETPLSSLISIRRAIVKEPDSLSRQCCLAQHHPKRWRTTVPRANKLSSIADGELPRGTRVDPRSPYVGDINRITTSSRKKQSPLFTPLPVQEIIVFRP